MRQQSRIKTACWVNCKQTLLGEKNAQISRWSRKEEATCKHTWQGIFHDGLSLRGNLGWIFSSLMTNEDSEKMFVQKWRWSDGLQLSWWSIWDKTKVSQMLQQTRAFIILHLRICFLIFLLFYLLFFSSPPYLCSWPSAGGSHHISLALLKVLILLLLWWLLSLLLFWLFLLTIAGTTYLPKNLEQPLKTSFVQIDVENPVYLMCKVSWTSAQLHACKSILSLQLWQLRYTRFSPASYWEHAEQLLWWSAPLGKQKGGVYSPIFCF